MDLKPDFIRELNAIPTSYLSPIYQAASALSSSPLMEVSKTFGRAIVCICLADAVQSRGFRERGLFSLNVLCWANQVMDTWGRFYAHIGDFSIDSISSERIEDYVRMYMESTIVEQFDYEEPSSSNGVPLGSIPPGGSFRFRREELIVLEHLPHIASVLTLRKQSWGVAPFDEKYKYDNLRNASIKRVLKQYLKYLDKRCWGKVPMELTVPLTEDVGEDEEIPPQFLFKGRVGLLTKGQYMRCCTHIPPDAEQRNWWLATPSGLYSKERDLYVYAIRPDGFPVWQRVSEFGNVRPVLMLSPLLKVELVKGSGG